MLRIIAWLNPGAGAKGMIAIRRTPVAPSIKFAVLLAIITPVFAIFTPALSNVASFPAHITAIAISACLTKFALFLADVVPVTGKLRILGHGHSGQSSGRHQGGNDHLAHNSIPFALWANSTNEFGLPTAAFFNVSSCTAPEVDCSINKKLYHI